MYDGMLNVYKEPGYTSHDVVAKLRGILKQKKIGHTGTLDPEAAGVLPVCLGRGTKLCDMISSRDKAYEARMLLGIATDTLDMTGTVLSEVPVFLLPDDSAEGRILPRDGAGTRNLPNDSAEGRVLPRDGAGSRNLPGNSAGDQILPRDGAGSGNLPDSGAREFFLTEAEITGAINRFIGEYAQMPPMYSALKVDGRRLYELARAGQTAERKVRTVHIYGIDIGEIRQAEDQKVSVTMRIRCSKGTYIRSLCDDIGRSLGCGAAMSGLVRTEAAGFHIEDSLTLARIASLEREGRLREYIVPVEAAFETLPQVYLAEASDRLLYNGNPFAMRDVSRVSGDLFDGANARVYDHQGHFLAVYAFDGVSGLFRAVKMFL